MQARSVVRLSSPLVALALGGLPVFFGSIQGCSAVAMDENGSTSSEVMARVSTVKNVIVAVWASIESTSAMMSWRWNPHHQGAPPR